MKFNTTIPIGLRALYLDEVSLYRSSLQSGNLPKLGTILNVPIFSANLTR